MSDTFTFFTLPRFLHFLASWDLHSGVVAENRRCAKDQGYQMLRAESQMGEVVFIFRELQQLVWGWPGKACEQRPEGGSGEPGGSPVGKNLAGQVRTAEALSSPACLGGEVQWRTW